MTDLSRIGDRDKLKPRKGDEPHWQRLRHGCYLGFRPSKRGGKGTWFARAYDQDKSRYRRRALGDYGSLSGHEVFNHAKRDAEAWGDKVESGGLATAKIVTVADACRSYLAEKPGKIAEGVFRRHVYGDPIASVKLEKLRRHHLRAWRKRLEETPAVISRRKKGEVKTKARAKSTVNRDMVPLRAALRQVLSAGAPNTDAAWQEALKPYQGAEKRREVYLDRSERRRLLDAMPADAVPFAQALCLLPLRPGALAGLRVRDFDKRTRTLTIGEDKNGRPRQISVPQAIADFITAQSKNKLPSAWLFARGDGSAWDRNSWKRPINAAAKAALLPLAVSAYTLRHSILTDLVRSGLPVLTVAQLADTSVEMIERHYGHFVRDDAEQALAGLAL